MSPVQFAHGTCTTRDGLQLYYRDYPPLRDAGLPVLCLHGLTRNCGDFEWIAPTIAAGRRVIALDLRGRGRSDYDADLSHYTPYQYVEDVWSLLDHLGIARVVCLGTSLGGLMAAIMCTQRDSAVAAVILNDIGPELAPEGIERIVSTTGTTPPVADWDGAIAQLKERFAAALPGLSDDLWRWLAQVSYQPIDTGGLDVRYDRNIGAALRAGLSGLRDDPWALFDQLATRPTLVLRGALSDILSAQLLATMHERYRELTSVVVPNRGHVPLLNEPEAVNAISKFLAVVE